MKKLLTYLDVFFTKRFFYSLAVIIVYFVLAFMFKLPLVIGGVLVALLAIALIYDAYQLFRIKNGLEVERTIPEKLSNGDDNLIFLSLKSNYNQVMDAVIIDELPIQFQQRDFEINTTFAPQQMKSVTYKVSPKKRGNYTFRRLNAIIRTKNIGLIERHYKFLNEETTATVYPSIIQMKKYEFLAISNQLREYGIKKLRKLGQSQEFEQIREYVLGDDYRNINWKATSRKHELMVNEYIDERSQRVYSIIDKGRVMKMPFEEMTLLDYAINASLAISNIVLKHQNKPGLITFSKRLDTYVPAEKRSSQMNHILEALYAQKTDFQESNYEHLFHQIRKRLNQRSLLLFFTNFETRNSMYRQIKYLRTIAKKHVLVVIFFENTELEEMITENPTTVEGVYEQTIGQKFAFEKEYIVRELNKYGIHTILTKPQDLTINTINKYLELRSRGLIN